LSTHTTRLSVLDGWRGLSILAVLAVHLLPLKYVLRADYFFATSGMAVFFCLSGYLITASLDSGLRTRAFWARRLAKVLPLAWLYLLLVVAIERPPLDKALYNFTFVANLDRSQLTVAGEHLWSLDLEVQFYVAIGLLWALLKRRSLWVIAVAYVLLLVRRHVTQIQADSHTLDRMDEILAGALLYGWTHSTRWQDKVRQALSVPLWMPILAFLLACSLQFLPLNTFRSLFCAWMIGASLQQSMAERPIAIIQWLDQKWLKYCASISYALYIVHPILGHHTWLGSGELVERYAKRPLLLLAAFALAHLATRYLEPWALRWARTVK